MDDFDKGTLKGLICIILVGTITVVLGVITVVGVLNLWLDNPANCVAPYAVVYPNGTVYCSDYPIYVSDNATELTVPK